MGSPTNPPALSRGRWMALLAALLGWLFDGFEMGLFPVVARPSLLDLLGVHGTPTPADDALVSQWYGLATAGFLVGAATGGVLFGWLGDRLGRVRAMSLSILTYALCTGLAALATYPWQIVAVRFLAALGMGGEWSLGVALVMEVWGGRSRAVLAGLIGAAANVGFAVAAVLTLGVQSGRFESGLDTLLSAIGLHDSWIAARLSAHSGWRVLMLAGMLPAVLTFFIRLFVPESERWQAGQRRGKTSSWASQDLLGVLIGAGAGCGILVLWVPQFGEWLSFSQAQVVGVRAVGTIGGLAIVIGGYVYPIWRYLQRSSAAGDGNKGILGKLALGAALSGVALLGTWASIQWATNWADELTNRLPTARPYTQLCSAMGAVLSSIIAPLVCDWLGRRVTYVLLCLSALGATLLFYRGNSTFGPWFLVSVAVAGGATATFYGWLPLYLPELFPTRVRATGQGFSFNFGRILAAIGALQTGALTTMFKEYGGLPMACSVMSLVYLVGLVVILFAPETKGKPLPE